MPSRLPEHAIVALLRQYYLAPRCQVARTYQIWNTASCSRFNHTLSPPRLRRQQHSLQLVQSSKLHTDGRNEAVATQSTRVNNAKHNGGGKKIAVIGGGITGLTAAHHLAKELPTATITIYEAGIRLGGWMQSEFVELKDGSKVLFEAGPRTLRPTGPASYTTAQLIEELDMEDEIVLNTKDSPAAKNRFVYHPDHLVRLPGPGQDLATMVSTLLGEPVFKDWWKALFEFRRSPDPRSGHESIASFLERRFGTEHIGNNLVSAVLHGIYAGNVHKLSARCIFGPLVAMELESGSMMKHFFRALAEDNGSLMLRSDTELERDLAPTTALPAYFKKKRASVYSFEKGISALSEKLEETLRANPKVTFQSGTPVTNISYANGGVKITSKNTPVSNTYQYAISAIPAKALSTLTTPPMPTLSNIHSVTVMVVNLYFTDPSLLPEHGFGYLIPQTVPFEQNPERALGVVFDSDALQGQDIMAPGVEPGTKVTVMLGGHWWDDFKGDYPSTEDGVRMARSILKRHLNITAEPAAVKATLQRDCIPQYYVSHLENTSAASQILKTAFKGKLKVAGSSFAGVSVHDCVKSGRAMALAVKAEDDSKVGMERFIDEEWVTVSRNVKDQEVRDA